MFQHAETDDWSRVQPTNFFASIGGSSATARGSKSDVHPLQQRAPSTPHQPATTLASVNRNCRTMRLREAQDAQPSRGRSRSLWVNLVSILVDVVGRVATKIAATGMAARASTIARGTVGALVALVALCALGAEVAHADYACNSGVDYYLPNPKGPDFPDIGMCEGDPPTTTPHTSPNTTPTTPTTQPRNTGGGPAAVSTTTPSQTTSPNIEQNADADDWSIVVNKNDGSRVSGWDVDDNSPGLGQEGINRYLVELTARGLDPGNPQYYNDSISLIVQTVNPADWSKYLDEVLSIPTTSTETATTTTTTAASSTTIEVTATSLTEDTSDPTTSSPTPPTARSSSRNIGAVVVIAAVSAACLTSSVLLVRRSRARRENQAAG